MNCAELGHALRVIAVRIEDALVGDAQAAAIAAELRALSYRVEALTGRQAPPASEPQPGLPGVDP